MHTLAFFILMILVIAVAVPVFVFAAEIVSAVYIKRKPQRSLSFERATRVAVVIPAHDESRHILPTIQDVRSQLGVADRLIVVADNCSDDTAAVCSEAGAEVFIRNDLTRIGKGYALDFAIQRLREQAPPDVVIFIDADCRVAENAVYELAAAVIATTQPCQACYLMTSSSNPTPGSAVAEFAWRVKNQLRPLGLAALKMPCQLAGTGMAFPWKIVDQAPLASGSLVEDLELGLRLAAAGNGAVFCPSAFVWSRFAASESGRRTQRTRWEQGHIQTIRELFWPTFATGLRGWDLRTLALALDLLVPPLSLLLLFVLGSLALTALASLAGLGWTPFWLSFLILLVFITALGVAWRAVGRDLVPIGQFGAFAGFALGKVALYRQIFRSGMGTRWVRTDRGQGERTDSDPAP